MLCNLYLDDVSARAPGEVTFPPPTDGDGSSSFVSDATAFVRQIRGHPALFNCIFRDIFMMHSHLKNVMTTLLWETERGSKRYIFINYHFTSI